MLRPMETPLPAAVVFDNDGLLLDTESVWTRAERDLFERRGLEFTAAHKRELVGTSAEIAGGILEQRLAEPGEAAQLIEELNELVVAELEHGVEAMVGARDLLHALKRRGTPIGLVSNSPLQFVRRSIEIVGFAEIFDAKTLEAISLVELPTEPFHVLACEDGEKVLIVVGDGKLVRLNLATGALDGFVYDGGAAMPEQVVHVAS